MNNKMIDTNNIRLGKITYFNTSYNGSAVPPVAAYVFLIHDGVYYNPFDLTMDLPVYDRFPYANVTKSGEEFGTKIKNVQGDVTDGPCIVLDKVNIGDYYGKDQMSIDMLKECILKSNNFFIDRIQLFEEEKGKLKPFSKEGRELSKKISNDKLQLDKLQIFMDKCKNENEIHHIR